MVDQDTYLPPPPRTQEDIDALVAFIRARVEPLRNEAFGSEGYKAFQALLDIVFFSKGVAQAVLERGEDPSVQFYYLASAARNWDDHPDFQSDWSA